MIDLKNCEQLLVLGAIWEGVQAAYGKAFVIEGPPDNDRINELLNIATETFDGMLIETPEARALFGNASGAECTEAMLRYVSERGRALCPSGLLDFLDSCEWLNPGFTLQYIFREGHAIAVYFDGNVPERLAQYDRFNFSLPGRAPEENAITSRVASDLVTYLNEISYIHACRCVRALTGIGLRDATDIIEKMLSLIDPEWRKRRDEKYFAARSGWTSEYHWDGYEFINVNSGVSLHRNMCAANGGALKRASSVEVTVKTSYIDLDEQDQMPKGGK